jgi:serine/threonine protein kinase
VLAGYADSGGRGGRALAGRGREERVSEGFLSLGGLPAGARVAGYRLEEPVGAGGMAVVYRARDERLGRLVALKVLAPAFAADEEFRRRFTAESRTAAAVDHPHIIPVYEAGEAAGALFIAMRLVTGGDLAGMLAQQGPLPPERAVWFLSPVASALDAAHRAGLVHRDVKPGNVLVDAWPGRPEHVYLSDFGISKAIMSTAGLTGSGQFLGTPEYTSPEQVKGQAVDGRADQYALACVAWHLLTGAVPFQRDQGLAVLLAHLHEPPPRLADRRPDLPAAAGQVLARAMAKEPEERYPSCGEFTDALRQALDLPLYRPAASGPRTEVSAPPAHPATAPAAARTPSRSGSDPITSTAFTDSPTEDAAVPGRSLRPGPGPDGSSARAPRRRRRYLMITLAGTLLAAAAVIPLLITRPGTPLATGPHAHTHTATPTASRKKPVTATLLLTGTRAATLTDPEGIVIALEFDPRGTTLAVGDANGNAYLWDTATGTLTATLTIPDHQNVAAVAFGPGGTTLAVGDDDGSTYLWDTATGRLTATFTDPHSKEVSQVAFNSAGTTLAVGDVNGSTFLWDTATGKLAATLTDPASKGVVSVAFNPDGTTLAAGDGNGSTYLWDTATDKVTATFDYPGSLGADSVAFGPGGTLAVLDTGSIHLWDIATGKLAATFTDPGGEDPLAMAFGPGGTILAVGDFNDKVYLWDTATGKLAATLTGGPGTQGVTSVALSPSGTILAAGDNDNGSTFLWRLSSRGP